jgi:hypothetical protein
MSGTQQRDIDQLKRDLQRLQMEQTRDLKLLGEYDQKQIPGQTPFVTACRKAIRYREERIAHLKDRLRSSD